MEGTCPVKWNLRLAAANRGLWKAPKNQRIYLTCSMDALVAPAPGDGGVEVRHLQDLGELFRGTSRCSVQDR
jgi:hypothetical protein